MTEQDNIQKVQQLYSYFMRGEIGAMLAECAEDAEWVAHVPTNMVSWGGTYIGADGGKFFQLLNEDLEFQEFSPNEFIAQGDRVVTLGHSQTVRRVNGQASKQDWVMVFTLKGGKMCRWDYFDDGAHLAQGDDRQIEGRIMTFDRLGEFLGRHQGRDQQQAVRPVGLEQIP